MMYLRQIKVIYLILNKIIKLVHEYKIKKKNYIFNLIIVCFIGSILNVLQGCMIFNNIKQVSIGKLFRDVVLTTVNQTVLSFLTFKTIK